MIRTPKNIELPKEKNKNQEQICSFTPLLVVSLQPSWWRWQQLQE